MFNTLIFLAFLGTEQPPPRGCVLKHQYETLCHNFHGAAASARLCVETLRYRLMTSENNGSRLRAAVCWNNHGVNVKNNCSCSRLRAAVCWNNLNDNHRTPAFAATFGRLCVETPKANILTARLPAATSARLRVETVITIKLPLLIRAAAYLRKDERR